MSRSVRFGLPYLAAMLLGVCVAAGFAAESSVPHYLITNDDVLLSASGITFYTIGTDGSLTLQSQVRTGSQGIGGGFFGTNRVNVLDSGGAKCVYASEAASGDIVGFFVRDQIQAGRAKGSRTDAGTSNGIGLAMNAQFLYASFTDSNTIGTFQVTPGCKLTFVGDITVGGLQGGIIDGMAIHGTMLIATYGDGSIESFNVSGGVPVSNGDKQNSTAWNGAVYANGIDITQDGHYAIFGDTSTSTAVEVSDISSGKLTPTIVYHLGSGISSSNILLSPDETMLYISNTQGDKVTAAFFDKTTGQVSKGCTSGVLKGYVSGWSYLAGLALQQNTGTGGTLYVAEFGAPSSIAVINIASSGGTCTLTESSTSPVADPNSPGLLSIATYPPRSF